MRVSAGGRTRVALGRAALGTVVCTATMLLGSVAAHAQQVDPYGGGRTTPSDPGTTTRVESETAAPASHSSSSLPFTGGDVAGLAAIGAAAVGAGVVASRARRRRTA
jgi:hypothetical protein